MEKGGGGVERGEGTVGIGIEGCGVEESDRNESIEG